MGDGSLWGGGIFESALRRLHILHRDGPEPRRLTLALVAVAWLPFVVLGVPGYLRTGHWDPVLLSLQSHLRWLVAAPLLLLAEPVVEGRVQLTLRYLRKSGLAVGATEATLHHDERRMAAWCKSRVLELLLLGLALIPTPITLKLTSSAPGWWYGMVAIPLFRFLLLRWAQRWLLWIVLLAHVSRLKLTLIGSHPDRAGGLGVLVQPSRAFGLVILALGTVVASELGMRLLAGMPFPHMVPTILAYVGLSLVLVVAPLLAFVPALVQTKRLDEYKYGVFARTYVHAFERRWLGDTRDSPLGSDDIQALNDLGGAYRVVDETRIVPFSARFIGEMTLVALLPILPVYLASVSIGQLARTLMRFIF